MVSRLLARYFAVLTAMTYVLVAFGAVVRSNGAGLACPDWPLCFGELVPRMDFGVILEWGHRALAGGVSLGLLLGIALIARSPAWRALRPWLGLSVAVLALQILLGGLTVLHLLARWTVSSHLIMGNAFALSLAFIAVALHERTGAAAPRPALTGTPRALALGLPALVLLQLALGGLVASSWAGLACVEWPACVGTIWFPTLSGPIGLHIAHRMTGYTLVLALLALAALARGRFGVKPTLAALLGLCQVAVGVANVLWRMPVEVTALHSALAAMIVLVTGLIARDAALSRRPMALHLSSTAEPA